MATTTSGEVPATDARFGDGDFLPTEKELAKNVLSLPSAVKGKLLAGANRQVVPSLTAGHVIKCSIERKSKMLPIPSTQESYSIVDSKNEPYAGGVYIQETKALAGLMGGRFVMFDSNNKPFCLAQPDKSTPLQRVYLIKGTEPLCGWDMADEKEDLVDFYKWFKIQDVDHSHSEFRALLVWNGKEYQPLMRIKSVPQKGSGALSVEKLVPLPARKTDLMVVDVEDESKVYAILSKKKASNESRTVGWQLCAAPGTDVTAMIMLAALLDDMKGWFD